MGFFDFLNPPELKPNELYRGYEQPSWKLMPNQPEDGAYEIRSYPAANWTATSAPSVKNANGTDRNTFWRLFGYITGKNDESKKMAMTVPVTMKMPRDSSPTSGYTMSFYTPSVHQGKPPQPTNPDVFIENREEITVYVRVFRGFAKRPEFSEQSKILYEDLKKHGVDMSTIDPDSFYAVGYDSPFRLVNRRNEVWFVAKDGKEEPANGTEEPVNGTEESANATEEPVNVTEEPANMKPKASDGESE